MIIKYKPIAFIVPDNFAHKAGDGLSTRDHHLKNIHPALQANPGSTQMTYVLEVEDQDICKLQLQMK